MATMPIENTAATATVILEMLGENEEILTKTLDGCFVEKEGHLKKIIEKSLSHSDHMNKYEIYEGSKYIFYSRDNSDLEGVISKAVIRYEEISKKFLKKDLRQIKTCEVENPLIIIFDGHFFLCCDSKDLNESKFLDKHSKKITIHQTLDLSESSYGLGIKDGHLQFIPFRMNDSYEIRDIERFEELKDAGPLLLDDMKTIVGYYRKKTEGNYRIEIDMFEINEETTSASCTDGGDNSSLDTPNKNGQVTGTPPSAPGGGNGQTIHYPTQEQDGTRRKSNSAEIPGDNDLVMQLRKVGIINAVMNSAQHQNPDVAEGKKEAKEHSLQVHLGEQAQSKEEPLVSDISSEKEMEKRVCLKLDRGNRTIANWESLADELNAPADIKAACRRATEESPTELLFEFFKTWSHTANLTVNTLIQLLGEINRNDAVEVITNAIPAQDRENKFSDKITNNPELLQVLAAKLDKESRVLKCWKHLGLKLEVKKEILQEIGNGNCPNAVEALFEYIYSTMPGLTVEEFMEKMVKIQRIDVMDLFTDIKTGKMLEVAPLHSDLMCSICYMLNKSSPALKNWRHFASELGIDYDTYKSFEPEPRQSPTSILLEWAHIEKGDTYTVRDFCKSLEKIKRYDAIELLEKEFGQKFR